MKFFSSNSTHKVDAKGRVSVPATFRRVLDGEAEPGVVFIPRMMGDPAIEGFGNARFAEYAAELDKMHPMSRERKYLAHKLLGQAEEAQIDPNGRVVLGEALRDAAGIEDQALFVGLGRSFQIWNPQTYKDQLGDIDEGALEHFDALPWAAASRGEA